ncbi:MAG: hypothetical protein JO253_05465, partial [Alphaproteobacteria bacterium]|nr:hypothetical protein [Alphaproteobacteria bacterium]
MTDAQIADMTAASYVFGAATAGDGSADTALLTVSTAHDFGTSNVTFVSGGSINLAGTLTKATGAGAVNYVFDAYRDIYNSNAAYVTATTGSINLTMQSDYDGNTTNGGAINLSGGTFSTGGGNITLGGGSGAITGAVVNSTTGALTTAATGFAQGDTTYSNGVSVNSTMNAGAGSVIVNGNGYASQTGASDNGIYFNGGGLISTTGMGNITLSGTNASTFSGGYNSGIGISGTTGSLATSAGNIVLVGNFNGAGANGNDNGININQISGMGSIIGTTGGGQIYLTGISAASSGIGLRIGALGDVVYISSNNGNIFFNGLGTGTATTGVALSYGNTINLSGNANLLVIGNGTSTDLTKSGSSGVTTISGASNTNNVTIEANTVNLPTVNYLAISTPGTLTIAQRTNTTTMGVGPTSGSGTLAIADGVLAYFTAGTYVFGTTGSTGLLTVNTAHDFSTSNVSFVSGGSINLAGTLTKATGSGTVNYIFDAYRDIYNYNNAGVTATTGGINLTLQSDYDGNTSTGGAIYLTGGSISTNGGNIVMGGGSGTITAATFNTNGTIATAATGYAQGDSTYANGVYFTTTLNAGPGGIVINGQGYTAGTANNIYGVYTNGTVQTSGANAINISGLGGGTGASANDYGVETVNLTATG